MKAYVYSDIDPRLTMLRTGTVRVQYDADVILQSIKNIIGTVSGERVRNPIGSQMVALLFQPMNQYTVQDIKTQLNDVLQWEPRISVTRINVIPNYDQNVYDITIDYKVSSLPGVQTFTTKLRTLYA